MNSPKEFSAPWSRILWLVSIFSSVLFLGGAGVLFEVGHGVPQWLAGLPLAGIVGGAVFTIRGYVVRDRMIVVRRLLWSTRLPLPPGTAARVDLLAMKGSLRTCGNGGLFSFSGFYWNLALGSFRAWVTDPERTVVVHPRGMGRNWVFSPDRSEDFVAAVQAECHDASSEQSSAAD